MATTLHDKSETEHAAETRTRGGALRGFFVLLFLVAAGLAVYGSTKFIDLGPAEKARAATHTVERGDLMITVTEDGNVESASNVELKCEVAGGSSILWIVEDGKEVEEGEKLIELDQAQLEEEINAQTITYEKARSASIQADKDFAVAKISVQEYLEGTFKKEIQDAEAQITIAEENLRSAKNAMSHSERMFRRGYISSLERESQEFAVQRAQLELDSAKTAKEVLEKFTKVKTLEDLRSQVETAQAKMESEKAALDLEAARLQRLKDQLSKCVIYAPAAGMVVYANESSRGRMGGSQTPQIELGAAVRERQDLLKLPDLKAMQVKVAVHETKVDKLRRGMKARIKIQGKEYLGEVTNVANQPEPTSWFSASVKEYGTTVQIKGESTGLRPGMTAEVEILVDHIEDCLMLPVAAIVDQGGRFYCWVVTESGEYEQRQVVMGASDDQFVEIKDGVAEGEQVILNPRAVVKEARVFEEEESEESVEDRFGAGAGSATDEATAEPEAGGSGRGGRPGGPGGGGRGNWGGGRPGGEGGGGRGNWGGGGGGGGRGGGMGNLMDNDKDGDGKISREEAPSFMERFFDRVDANGDGAIDQGELDQMRQRRGQGGGGRPGGRPGGPGGGGDAAGEGGPAA